MSTTVPYSDSTPPKAVIAIQRGTDQARVFQFQETDTEDPIDVAEVYSDFALEVRVRQNPSSTRLLRYTLGDGMEITDTDKLTLTIPKEDTADIEGGVYWFDLVCVKSGSAQALIQGRFEINNNVTILEEVS